MVKKRKGFSTQEKQNILKMTDCRCAHCGKKIDISKCTIEHLYPVSKGGSDSKYNITVLCEKCNLDKSNFTINDINYYYKYIKPDYIESYMKQYDIETGNNRTDDCFLDYSEQRFYYMTDYSKKLIGNMIYNKNAKYKQLLKIANAQIRELTLERAYFSDLKEMLDDNYYGESEYLKERGISPYQLRNDMYDGNTEVYIIRTQSYKYVGILVMDKAKFSIHDITNTELIDIISQTGLKLKYIIRFIAMFSDDKNDELFNSVVDYIVITAISKGYMIVDQVYANSSEYSEDYKDEHFWKFKGDYYDFPRMKHIRGILNSYLRKSDLCKDDTDRENMIDYILNIRNKLSKEDLSRYASSLNINNLYTQLNPKKITKISTKITPSKIDRNQDLVQVKFY